MSSSLVEALWWCAATSASARPGTRKASVTQVRQRRIGFPCALQRCVITSPTRRVQRCVVYMLCTLCSAHGLRARGHPSKLHSIGHSETFSLLMLLLLLLLLIRDVYLCASSLTPFLYLLPCKACAITYRTAMITGLSQAKMKTSP